jgi:hypothetical protein
MRNGHMAWTEAGVVVTGEFMGRDTETGLAYVKTEGRQIHFSQPADLRRQLKCVAPGGGDHDHVSRAAGGPQDVRGGDLVMRIWRRRW